MWATWRLGQSSHNAVAWTLGWLTRQGFDKALVNGKSGIVASRITAPEDPHADNDTVRFSSGSWILPL